MLGGRLKSSDFVAVLKNYVVSGVLESEPLSGATRTRRLMRLSTGRQRKDNQNVTLIGAGLNEFK